VDFEIANVYEVADGKLRRVRVFRDARRPRRRSPEMGD
jgi:hypothetical protein